jgi:hypothetical protein
MAALFIGRRLSASIEIQEHQDTEKLPLKSMLMTLPLKLIVKAIPSSINSSTAKLLKKIKFNKSLQKIKLKSDSPLNTQVGCQKIVIH